MSTDQERDQELGRLRAEVTALRQALGGEGGPRNRVGLAGHLDALVRLSTEARYRGHPPLEAIQATLELAAAVLDVDRASAWLLDSAGTLLECLDLLEHRTGQHAPGPVLKAEDYPRYFDAILTQRAVDASDALTDPRTSEFGEGYLIPLGIASLLDAAIRRQGATLGVVCFEQIGRQRQWTLDEVSLAGQVADHVARILAEDERHRAQEALAQSERNYREIFNATSDALLIHDEGGRLLDLNERMCAMFGLAREAAISCSWADLSQGEPPYTQAAAEALLRQALTEGPQTFEWRCRRGDGTLFWSEVSLRASVIGGARRVIASVRDITSRKEAEAERSALQAQLQQAMKMEAVGQLAGGIAHDFNNLLTAIGFNIELAQLELAPASTEHGVLLEALRATESATALTRQLLAFSRRQMVEPQLLDLRELVGNVESLLRRLIGEDIALDITVQEGAWNVKADPAQLEQVLVNLAVNARDAMPAGGRLSIATANVRVPEEQSARHGQACAGAHVRLRVTDTGHGMSEEVLAHVFEPFYTTKSVGSGTGLGLSTSFGIIQQAGGFIEVQSEVDAGATFDLYLPRATALASGATPAKVEEELPRGTETVLLVEDEPLVGDVALTLLERLGYRVLYARSGADAIGLAQAQPHDIDLLLTDVVLPGMNGRELAAQLAPLQPRMRVIFASGYTEDVVLRHGVVEERLDFLAKPYRLRSLACKVREVLDR